MDGLLLIDKPHGWTSFDVVAKVRGILRQAVRDEYGAMSKSSTTQSSKLNTPLAKVKVGHTGTLDPLATGLLVLTIGSYCKRAQEFSKLDKTYEVTMRLGLTSTTGDDEGVKQAVSDKQPVESEVASAVQRFIGEIMQVPPIYSAIKVGGQRAYKLARAGKEVVLDPRKVIIYQISDISYTYPEVRFTAQVSSGTYVRSLVEDIGKVLETGAYMTALRRRSVGDFKDESMLQINELQDIDKHLIHLPETKV